MSAHGPHDEAGRKTKLRVNFEDQTVSNDEKSFLRPPYPEPHPPLLQVEPVKGKPILLATWAGSDESCLASSWAQVRFRESFAERFDDPSMLPAAESSFDIVAVVGSVVSFLSDQNPVLGLSVSLSRLTLPAAQLAL